MAERPFLPDQGPVGPFVRDPKDELDPVWKALADPTRRAILDLLRDRPRRTSDVVEAFPDLSRFAVMKHLDVLERARLVTKVRQGREVLNSLNAVPIRRIYERWVRHYEDLWSQGLLRIKEAAEKKRDQE